MHTATKRIGRFSIEMDLIEDNPEAVLLVMAEVIVTRAELIFHKKHIAYVAISEHFEPYEVGTEPPEYDIQITGNEVTFLKAGDE